MVLAPHPHCRCKSKILMIFSVWCLLQTSYVEETAVQADSVLAAIDDVNDEIQMHQCHPTSLDRCDHRYDLSADMEVVEV
jgi:hypothetical protein